MQDPLQTFLGIRPVVVLRLRVSPTSFMLKSFMLRRVMGKGDNMRSEGVCSSVVAEEVPYKLSSSLPTESM